MQADLCKGPWEPCTPSAIQNAISGFTCIPDQKGRGYFAREPVFESKTGVSSAGRMCHMHVQLSDMYRVIVNCSQRAGCDIRAASNSPGNDRISLSQEPAEAFFSANSLDKQHSQSAPEKLLPHLVSGVCAQLSPQNLGSWAARTAYLARADRKGRGVKLPMKPRGM